MTENRNRTRPRIALVGSTVVVFALARAFVMPRGPVTASQAVTTLLAALVVGAVTSATTGRRWSIVLAPAAFAIVVELGRTGAWGPTVDAPTSFGALHLIAFSLGRVVHGLLASLPMILGGLLGLSLAPRLGVRVSRLLGTGGWIDASTLANLVVAIGVAVTRPATTPPITNAGGDVIPGSITELVSRTIGGHEQAIMIRGRDASLPVLLHLAGGPGGADIGAMRLDDTLEQQFVVVAWDHRGTGTSYPVFDQHETMTLDQVVADTIDVSEYLVERFGHDRIYIAGQSWGAIPATLAAQQRPDLCHALIATGQVVDIRETDRSFYEDTLAWARSGGNADLLAHLETMGPPPCGDLVGQYPVIVGPARTLNPFPEVDVRKEVLELDATV